MVEPIGTEVVLCRDLTVVHDGRTVLSVPEFDIHEGERWALLGPNGSGKTTLLSVIAGRQWPSSGEVTLLGHRLGRVDVRELRVRLGFLSAAVTRSLRPRISAHDVVVTGVDGALEPWWRTYDDADHRRADGLLASLGLAEAADRQVGVLSEGERAKVLLARLLMAEPALLCLDEPAAGLDLGARESLISLLGELMASPDPAPVVLVTHHLEELPSGLTHAALLRDGSPIAIGPIDEVITTELVSKAFDIDVVVEKFEDGRFSARSRRTS